MEGRVNSYQRYFGDPFIYDQRARYPILIIIRPLTLSRFPDPFNGSLFKLQ